VQELQDRAVKVAQFQIRIVSDRAVLGYLKFMALLVLHIDSVHFSDQIKVARLE
jgi:hypothetical protein